MKRLLLIRHGEAEHAADSDFQRSLTEKGSHSIISVAQILIDHQLFPQSVVASSAQRTIETTLILCEAMRLPHRIVRYHKSLYTHGTDAYISEIFAQNEDVESLMIVGHNPSISQLANHFSSDYFISMPPGGFVVIDFETDDWNQLFSVESKLILENTSPEHQ